MKRTTTTPDDGTAEAVNSPTPNPAPTPAIPSGRYEVVCHAIEIDGLICYRTHRLTLTKERADSINTMQPGSLRFVGV